VICCQCGAIAQVSVPHTSGTRAHTDSGARARSAEPSPQAETLIRVPPDRSTRPQPGRQKTLRAGKRISQQDPQHNLRPEARAAEPPIGEDIGEIRAGSADSVAGHVVSLGGGRALGSRRCSLLRVLTSSRRRRSPLGHPTPTGSCRLQGCLDRRTPMNPRRWRCCRRRRLPIGGHSVNPSEPSDGPRMVVRAGRPGDR
jgi:hypothetical protein